MKTAVKTLIVIGLMALTATTSWVLAKDSRPDYREIPPEMLAQIEASDKAFMEKNLNVIAEHMAEDFEWHVVNADGEKLMVSGRTETLQRLEGFFTMDTGWTNADVHRLGYLGNIFVQIEVDYYDTPDGKKTVPSLSVYEMKDGQRWREWKFYPAK
ncbi:MAG: nuclear transport factor 2 family protein [Gammaproteobacteria bacterium]|nr:nuclear transport factor 2 family protein [Gammaproteobacteria bacterium]MDP6674543.1 nuclear transport factor 2 family protein [Gammaproteobacteria bacterium]